MSAAIKINPMPVTEAGPVLLAAFQPSHDDADFRFAQGWSRPEDGLRWSDGDTGCIEIAAGWVTGVPSAGRIIASIKATPFLGEIFTAFQQISITVNGAAARDFKIDRLGLLNFQIPLVLAGAALRIEFNFPTARRPVLTDTLIDMRKLAIAFQSMQIWFIPNTAATVPQLLATADTPPAEILGRFESLGDNCEFGIVQRLSGIEPLGLLRFTATPLPSLINGLLSDFAGLGNPDFIELDIRGDRGEYILFERRYNLTYHTFIYADELKMDEVLRRESKKLTLMRRRMMDDLRAARRIYVIKHNDGLLEDDVIILSGLLRTFGPNNLLYVSSSRPDAPPGTVTLRLPGLAFGTIEKFAPYDNAANTSVESWVNVCAKTASMFSAERSG
jgi:hypothetical protein